MIARRNLSPGGLSLGLALTIAFLAGFAIFSALSTQVRADSTSRELGVAHAFADARFTVSTEESLERKYRLEPGPDILAQHHAAGRSLVEALMRARAVGDDGDVAVVDGLLVDHARYLEATAAMFAAVDAGDPTLTNQIDTERVDPIFGAIEQEVFAEADEHAGRASASLDDLRAAGRWVLAANVGVFAIGCSFLLLFWRLLGRYRRDAGEADKKQLALTLARGNEERFRSLVQNAADVITILDADGHFTYVSSAALHLWRELPVDRQLLSLVHPEDVMLVRAYLADSLAVPEATVRSEFRIADPDGGWRTYQSAATNLIHRAAVAGVVAVFHDITERKAFEAQLSHLAFYDLLTGLPNRALALDRLEQALAHRARRRGSAAVLYLDLDDFKNVNDRLGHEIGDQVLVETARRITGCIRAEDTAARMGGDEFVVVLDCVGGSDGALEVAQRIGDAVRMPIRMGSQELFVDASTGVAVAGERDDPDAILRKADLAMYRAKKSGKGSASLFDDAMGQGVTERLELETDLRHAVERGELRVHYQPIVSLVDGSVRELEALVRWQHPVRGLLAPLAFIGIAEESGLIVPIGQWVLEESLRQLATWGELAAGLVVSVNLSARQFRHPRLVDDVVGSLGASGIRPEHLKLEITESDVMEDADEAVRQLNALRATGVRLAIDDFGTGYSSLAYLSRFPVDTLKIDRTFVEVITSGSETEISLLRGIVGLALTLNLSVVAEGIETQAQLDLLRSFGCPLGQGYFFAKPAPAKLIEGILSARPSVVPGLTTLRVA